MHARPGWTTINVPGTCHHDELHGADHVFPPIPAPDFGERIRADNEHHFSVRRFDALDCMDRITFLATFFQPRWNESRIVRACELHHPVAVLITRPGFLQRWI